jgi:hypothetical protein
MFCIAEEVAHTRNLLVVFVTFASDQHHILG